MKIDRLARRLPVLVLVTLLAGCVTYWPKTPPSPGATTTFPDRVRVTRTDASTVMLIDARVDGDSLRGTPVEMPQREIAIALAEVKQVEARQENAKATVALVLVSALLALGAWFVIAYATTTT